MLPNGIKGQAMVEFTLMLFLIMSLCAGMFFCIRLLTFQFWAQQEARFLAFEQTWPRWQIMQGSSAAEALEAVKNSSRFRRPALVDSLDADKNVEDSGGMSDLILLLAAADTDTRGLGPKFKEQGAPPRTLLASLFFPRTGRNESWHEGEGKKRDSEFSLINKAWAVQDFSLRESQSRFQVPDHDLGGEFPTLFLPGWSRGLNLEKVFIGIMEKAEVGVQICSVYQSMVSRAGYPRYAKQFASLDCAPRFNRSFGTHLGMSRNFKSFFRTFEFRLERNQGLSQALLDSGKVEFAREFYSFFDQQVRQSAASAPAVIQAGSIEYLGYGANPDIARLLSSMRYVGSQIALQQIIQDIALLATANSSGRSWKVELERERNLNKILHADYDEGGVNAPNSFSLSPAALPMPQNFGSLLGGLQSGVMANVLDREQSLVGPLIEDSNKAIGVTYHADKGIFPAAKKRFDTEGITLSGRFFLVTQPWHVLRRNSGTGAWRELGGETDGLDLETEEAMLRRRTWGLWLFPKQASGLLDPVIDAPGLEGLSGVFDSMRGLEGTLSDVFEFMVNNPLNDIANALSEIPGLGSIVPTMPKWPAVRPAAYPNSTEIDNDMMTGQSRNFNNYVDEQREFQDRAPTPEYDD